MNTGATEAMLKLPDGRRVQIVVMVSISDGSTLLAEDDRPEDAQTTSARLMSHLLPVNSVGWMFNGMVVERTRPWTSEQLPPEPPK